jgi:uncharacterized protein (TIGR03437 family)
MFPKILLPSALLFSLVPSNVVAQGSLTFCTCSTFYLGTAGQVTAVPSEVIAGSRSIKGSFSGTSKFTPYLRSNPAALSLLSAHSYRITFSYRILVAPSDGFETLFLSSKAASTGNFLPSTRITGKAGDSGTRTLTNTLGQYADYELWWEVNGTGAIAIDDIELVDVTTGLIIASENAERATVGLSFQVTDKKTFPLGPSGQYNFLSSAAIRDLDGDGYPEAILTVRTYPDFIRQPVITVGAKSNITSKSANLFPNGIPKPTNSTLTFFSDLNGDGLQDILFSDAGLDAPPWTGARISVALGQSDGTFRDVSDLIPSDLPVTRSYSLASGDIDGDGQNEIILPDGSGPSDGAFSALLRWNGSRFDAQRNWINAKLWSAPESLNKQSWLGIRDLDGDGKQDLIIGGMIEVPSFRIVFGSSGGFTPENLVKLPEGPFGHTPSEPYSSDPLILSRQGADVTGVIVADFNNDGRLDIFSLQEQVGQYKPGGLTDQNCPNYASVRANGGDCSGDTAVQMLINNESREFVDYSSASPARNLGKKLYVSVNQVDVNGDGFLDVVGMYVLKNYGTQVGGHWGTTFFINDGTGAFQVVDGAELLPVVGLIGSFLPTLVTQNRTEGVIVEPVNSVNELNIYKVVADSIAGTGPGFIDPAPFGAPGFNEFYYLRNYADAAAAVQSGAYATGLAHYLAVGKNKGYKFSAHATLRVSTVVSAASLQPGVASSTWISIFGAGFTSTARPWAGLDFAGSLLPISLDGISVKINGKPAYIGYIGPEQINVLSPEDVFIGDVQIEVTTPQGKAFATVLKQKVAPAFFYSTSGSRNYVAAVHQNGTYVTAANPARIGETILLYGTGFGGTTPFLPTSQIVSQPAPLTLPANVYVGGVSANVQFAGLVGSGLYQLNVTIPNVPAGDQTVQATITGFQSADGILLPVRAD